MAHQVGHDFSNIEPRWWVPTQETTWQIQLSGKIDTNVEVDAIEIDADTDEAIVQQLLQSGKKVIAYVSAGSFEDWRSDAKTFPANVKGKALDGWPGECWLDVRDLAVLGPIMRTRAEAAKAKGFHGIDWDNVDGYTNKTGFKIKAKDQLAYNRMLASIAHDLGMGVALKNDVDQIADLVDDFDWGVNEEAGFYDEVDKLTGFLEVGKAVVGLEYPGSEEDHRSYKEVVAKVDPRSYTLIKKMDLGAWGIAIRTMKEISFSRGRKGNDGK